MHKNKNDKIIITNVLFWHCCGLNDTTYATDTRCGGDDDDNFDTYTPIVIEKGAATSIDILLDINEMVSV